MAQLATAINCSLHHLNETSFEQFWTIAFLLKCHQRGPSQHFSFSPWLRKMLQELANCDLRFPACSQQRLKWEVMTGEFKDESCNGCTMLQSGIKRRFWQAWVRQLQWCSNIGHSRNTSRMRPSQRQNGNGIASSAFGAGTKMTKVGLWLDCCQFFSQRGSSFHVFSAWWIHQLNLLRLLALPQQFQISQALRFSPGENLKLLGVRGRIAIAGHKRNLQLHQVSGAQIKHQ